MKLSRGQRPGGDRIGTGRFETFLRRLLSVKGVIAPDVEGIVATLSVDDLIPEHLYLRGTRSAWGSIAIPAPAVGDYAEVSLSPPLTVQPTLYLIEKLLIQSDGGAASVRINVGPALPGTGGIVGETNTRDERWGYQSAPSLRVLGGSSTGLSLLANYISPVVLAGYALLEVECNTVLTANVQQQSLNINLNADAQELRVTAYWRERPLEPSER